MKKKISFKMFCSVIGRGVWQFICWIGGMFGIKDQSTFGRFVKRVFMVSVSAIALMIAVSMVFAFLDHIIYSYNRYHSDDDSDMTSRVVSDDYTYYTNYWRPGYVKNNTTGEKILKDLVWFYEPAKGDSLALYKTNENKRGYFNIFTGEVQIQPQFEKAWIFSGGLASVMKDGKIIFINSRGNQAFDKSFHHPKKTDGYVFHGNHCAVESDNGKVGLIDRNGDWAIAPEYDRILPYDNKWWIVMIGDKEGVINDSLTLILPTEYYNVTFANDGNGIYASKDGVRQKFDLEGNMVEDFIVSNTRELMYDTDEIDNESNTIMKMANCLVYSIDYTHEGLMSSDGKPLTKAIYYEITAVSPTRFKAEIEPGEAVILDEKGNIIN